MSKGSGGTRSINSRLAHVNGANGGGEYNISDGMKKLNAAKMPSKGSSGEYINLGNGYELKFIHANPAYGKGGIIQAYMRKNGEVSQIGATRYGSNGYATADYASASSAFKAAKKDVEYIVKIK